MSLSAEERGYLHAFVEVCQRLVGRYTFGEFHRGALMSLIGQETPPVRSKLALVVADGITSDIGRRLESEAESQPVDVESVPTTDRRVELALLFIRRHFHEADLRIAEAAHQVGVSSSRLEHLITRETGVSWGVHVRNTRLRNARRLLMQTRLSVKEVAAAVGYRYASSMDRDFRNIHGRRPSDLRIIRRPSERSKK